MILVGYDIQTIVIVTLSVSLAALVLVIAYRKLLNYLGKGTPDKRDFCVLYALESQPASGEVEFYFTCESPKSYNVTILDSEMQEYRKVSEGKAAAGGTIVRYDTRDLANGTYYYCLQTSNQKTIKKMVVDNR